MSRRKLSRRQFVAATALSSAALLTAPYIRTAHAAGKLTMGFWDHWVPGATNTSTELVNEWAAKEKVEVSIDYIASQGNKILLTIAAEGQAKSGHDIMAMPSSWRRGPARRAGSRSASASVKPATRSIPPAHFSRRLALSSSTPKATSRSRPTRYGRLSNSTRS